MHALAESTRVAPRRAACGRTPPPGRSSPGTACSCRSETRRSEARPRGAAGTSAGSGGRPRRRTRRFRTPSSRAHRSARRPRGVAPPRRGRARSASVVDEAPAPDRRSCSIRASTSGSRSERGLSLSRRLTSTPHRIRACSPAAGSSLGSSPDGSSSERKRSTGTCSIASSSSTFHGGRPLSTTPRPRSGSPVRRGARESASRTRRNPGSRRRTRESPPACARPAAAREAPRTSSAGIRGSASRPARRRPRAESDERTVRPGRRHVVEVEHDQAAPLGEPAQPAAVDPARSDRDRVCIDQRPSSGRSEGAN